MCRDIFLLSLRMMLYQDQPGDAVAKSALQHGIYTF